MQNKKVLIVGSKGYLGSLLYKQLEKKKFNIFGIDNFLYGKTWKKDNYQKNFKKIDLRDISHSFLKKFSHVVFLAGLSNNPIDNLFPEKAYKIVENYTLNFAKLCKKYNIKFIFPSSCSVYGKAKYKFLDEKSRTNPITFYSKNKLNIEKKLIRMSNINFKPIILRFGTIFGYSPSIRFDLVLNMFCIMLCKENKIYINSDGQANRPHLSIEDAVHSIILSLSYSNKKPLILNVGYNNFNKKIIDVAKVFSNLKKNTKIEFIYKNKKKSLFKDNLVNKKDERNYIVNFNKIKKIFPKFCKHAKINNMIKKFYKKMKKIKSNEKNINFYRLQKISTLIEKRKVNKKNLRCIN
jgi:nucleoside-diphosphate-sugar epimerase